MVFRANPELFARFRFDVRFCRRADVARALTARCPADREARVLLVTNREAAIGAGLLSWNV